MKDFKLQVMASDHLVFDGLATSIVLPTTEGYIGILADHSNLIMAAAPGLMEFVPSKNTPEDEENMQPGIEPGVRQHVVISDGLIKVENGEVMVLVDTAERPEDIDENRARRAAEQAKEEMKRSKSNREYTLISAELSRAMSRIKASKNRHKF